MWRSSRHALFSLLMIYAGVQGAQTERPPGTYALSIDRQPLDAALQQLAHQCGVQVIFFSRVTEGVAAPAIHGQYTLDAAMQSLLAGSNLTFRMISAETVEVRPVQAKPKERPASREPPAASENPETGTLEEVVVVGLAEQLVATRIATPLRDIPQSVSIVTREQVRQQNSLDLGDVLSHVPGITTTRLGSLYSDYLSRGYLITSLHVDGGAALDTRFAGIGPVTVVPAELNEFDHVEVLRGSDALFSGSGNPGGTLSLIRKLPQRVFALDTNATLGSWDKARLEVDVTGPIALDGALRARADAVYARSDYFYDSARTERTKLFAALAWDLTPGATLIAGGSRQLDDAVPSETGLPRNADGSDAQLPRDTSFVFDWQKQRTRITEAYLQYRQTFGGDWQLKLNAARWEADADVASGFFGGFIDPVTHGLPPPQLVFTDSPIDLEQTTADATLTGVLDWFGRRQEIAVGGDITRSKSKAFQDEYDPLTPLANVHSFDPAAYPDPRPLSMPDVEFDRVTRQEQYGVFVSTRAYLSDAWSVVAGARIAGSSFDSDADATFGGLEFSSSVHRADTQIVTPYAGLMYNVDKHYTLYASYADIYDDSSEFVQPNGQPIGVKHGATVEAGLKAQWRDGALEGSLALYRIEQNDTLLNFAPPISGMEYDDPCCFVGVDSRSKGVDLELSGEVRRGWRVGLGYSYNENELTGGGGLLSPITPKHLLKAWTSLRLPGALDRWAVGGSLHAQSEASTAVFNGTQGVQPSYAVLDLRAGFDIDSRWQVALSVNNALDKTYYESIGLAPFENWYGEPRNWTFRIDARY